MENCLNCQHATVGYIDNELFFISCSKRNEIMGMPESFGEPLNNCNFFSDGTRYIDERGFILTRDELEEEYKFLKGIGEIEMDSFQEYLADCLGKNGTLEIYEEN